MQWDYTKIAQRLSRGQKSTIRYMDENFVILGCSEPTAIRLSKPAATRPALIRRHDGKFALTDHGAYVRDALISGERA